MLEKNFSDIYTKFKMSLYSKVFNQDIKVEDALSAMEVLCVELIYNQRVRVLCQTFTAQRRLQSWQSREKRLCK